MYSREFAAHLAQRLQEVETALNNVNMLDVVERDGKHYLVSTVVSSIVGGWQTMVFASSPDGEISSYHELVEYRWASTPAAVRGHKRLVRKWKPD